MSQAITNDEGLTRYGKAVMGTYGQPMRTLTKGEGSYVWDADGRKYLDLLGGIAVNALGHAHPGWIQALITQAGTLAHASNFFATGPQIALAEKLLDVAQAPAGSRVFFCNSGTEANEASFKMARRTGRTRMIALEGGFHGRSMGALALTHKPAIREPFEPLPGEVTFVKPGDTAGLAEAMGEDVAGVVLEVIQGEAGVRPLPIGFLADAREMCDRFGALLVVDEIQTGIGRTGAMFAHQLAGVTPDVMTLAKGLGGGFPIGAVVAYGEKVGSLLGKGDHGTTFGGNPLASAVALATLETIQSEGLIQRAKDIGEWLRAELEAVPGVKEVRGEGLLLAVGLEHDLAPETLQAALAAGFILNAPGPDTIRLIPALTITKADLAPFIAWLREHLASHGHPEHVAEPSTSAGGAS